MTTEKDAPYLVSGSSPSGWVWSKLDASRPRRATEHLTHSEVSRVTISRLRPSDAPPGATCSVSRDIPVIAVDTGDGYWAFERVMNKLHGYAGSEQEAKADLLDKLAAHLNLLSRLESPRMAPILTLELRFLRSVLRPTGTAGA